MKYYVAYGNTISELIKVVGKYLEMGWRLQGGVSALGVREGFIQALIKRDEDV
jgi:hypothetical protein